MPLIDFFSELHGCFGSTRLVSGRGIIKKKVRTRSTADIQTVKTFDKQYLKSG